MGAASLASALSRSTWDTMGSVAAQGDPTPAPSSLSFISTDVSSLFCPPRDVPVQRNQKTCALGDGSGHLLLGRVVVMQKLCAYGLEWSWMAEEGNVSCVLDTSRAVASWRVLRTDFLLLRRPGNTTTQPSSERKRTQKARCDPQVLAR